MRVAHIARGGANVRRPTLEDRVAALEREVAELKTAAANGSRTKDWRRAIDMLRGDEGMREIFDAALKEREKDRERARRRYARTRQPKR